MRPLNLKTISIKEFRGIRSLDLAPDRENLVIWGYNGTGKSAIIDAIEFLLTGDVQRLRGSGTKGITLRSHAPHVDADPEDAIVTAELGLESGDTIKISRSVGDPNSLSCPDEAREELQELFEACENRHFMLTRRDILTFVQATDKRRAQQMEPLLNLEDIEEVRQVLVTAANTATRKSSNADAAVATARRRICQLLGLDEYTEQGVLEGINDLRKVMEAEPIETLESSMVMQRIEPPTAKSEDTAPDTREVLRMAARSLLKEVEVEDDLDSRTKDLQKHLETLKDDPELQELADRKRLFQIGADLVGDVDECPLCGKSWEPDQLEAHIQECLNEASRKSDVLDQLRDAADALKTPAANTLAAIEAFEASTKDLEPGLSFANVKKSLQATTSFLQSPATEYKSYSEDIRTISDFVRLLPLRDKVQELAAQVPEEEGVREESEAKEDDEQETVAPVEAWESLTKTEDRLSSLDEAELRQEMALATERRAAHLRDVFVQARDEELEQLYGDVSAHFSSLYETIHSPDEESFDATLQTVDAGVDMKVPFYGRGSFAPNALHSEGHQDSMGLCLFLSLREHLPGDTLPIVLLDDVVMSIDSGHRKEVARLLKERFSEVQFIITTHDKNWARQLRGEGVVSNKGRVDLYNWDVETGPLVNTVGDFLEKVRSDLNVDVNAAAARLRRGAEAYFSDACHNLRATVVYDNYRRWTLGDFLPSAVSKMGKLLSAGKQLANRKNDQELRSRLQQLDDKRGQASKKLQLERWAVNPVTHFTRWEDLSPNEMEDVVDAFEALFQVFTCEQCDSQLRVLMDEHDVGGVACALRCTSWFLEE